MYLFINQYKSKQIKLQACLIQLLLTLFLIIYKQITIYKQNNPSIPLISLFCLAISLIQQIIIKRMKKQMTLIYYYVPQDKDDPQVPNVFGINIKKDEIRFKNIYQNFPITGQYIFRFKVLYENNIAWLDLPDVNAKLPTFKQKIMIKASRVSWQNKKNHIQIKAPSVSNIKSATNTNNTSLLNHSPQPKSKNIPSSPSIKQQKPLSKQSQISDSFNLIDEVHQNHSKINQNNDDLI